MSVSDRQDRRIGRYRVERILGAGGFATVLEAVDDRLEDRVAIKVLAENHSLDPDVRQRFLAEGRVLRRIDSPYVVRVLDLGETDRQQPFLVLELADRGTLEARVLDLRTKGWRAQAADALALVRALGAGLAAVHRASVVHRDLSPGNVLLRTTLAPNHAASSTRLLADDERMILADLGLSKDLALSSGLTVAGGTEGFRPPEQRGGPGAIDLRADLWSASALVTWVVAGQRPSDADHAYRLLTAGTLPAGAVAALVRGLATEPAQRQADIAVWTAALIDALEPASAALPPPPTPSSASSSDTQALQSASPSVGARSLHRWWAAGLLAALLVGGLIGAGTWALATSPPRPHVEVADDGSVRTTVSDEDLRATIVGPSSIVVGETAVFRAETAGAAHLAWIGPDGRIHADVGRLDVQATSPGQATVTLTATGSGGRSLRAVHQMRVVQQ